MKSTINSQFFWCLIEPVNIASPCNQHIYIHATFHKTSSTLKGCVIFFNSFLGTKVFWEAHCWERKKGDFSWHAKRKRIPSVSSKFTNLKNNGRPFPLQFLGMYRMHTKTVFFSSSYSSLFPAFFFSEKFRNIWRVRKEEKVLVIMNIIRSNLPKVNFSDMPFDFPAWVSPDVASPPCAFINDLSLKRKTWRYQKKASTSFILRQVDLFCKYAIISRLFNMKGCVIDLSICCVQRSWHEIQIAK